MCPNLIERLSWNGPTVHVCCFMLGRASTKTFVSRVQKTAKKSSLAEKFVSRVTRDKSLSRILCFVNRASCYDLCEYTSLTHNSFSYICLFKFFTCFE